MISTLGLSSSPVGVRMLSDPKDLPSGAERLERHRYCQALMKARRGQDVFLDGEGISCPAAGHGFWFSSTHPRLRIG